MSDIAAVVPDTARATADEALTERIPPLVPAPEVPRRSRAGRNLPAAIGVGVGIGAAIVASLLIYRQSFVFLLVVVIL